MSFELRKRDCDNMTYLHDSERTWQIEIGELELRTMHASKNVCSTDSASHACESFVQQSHEPVTRRFHEQAISSTSADETYPQASAHSGDTRSTMSPCTKPTCRCKQHTDCCLSTAVHKRLHRCTVDLDRHTVDVNEHARHTTSHGQLTKAL